MDSVNGTESVTSSQQGAQNISRDQKSLKNVIFEFLFILIKDDRFSVNLYFVLIYIQFIQILYFAFSKSVRC